MGNNLQLKNILTISVISLLFAHLMVNTYVSSMPINILALIGIAYFIYDKTLRKNDRFSFLMVSYFMSAFTFLSAKGGGVNLIVFTIVALYIFLHKKNPIPKSRDNTFNLLLGMFIIGSVLGWVFNYAGGIVNLMYSITSFFGIIFLIKIAFGINLTAHQISTFIKLNIVIVSYAIIAFINARIGIFKINSFLLPSSRVAGYDYVELSGIIGPSPILGEYNMLMSLLFLSFLLLSPNSINLSKKYIFIGTILTISAVVGSISRSVFLLTALGMTMMVLFQFVIYPNRLKKSISQFVLISLVVLSVFFTINYTGIGYVFDRLESYEEDQGGISGYSFESIKNGSAFNRVYAFSLAQEKYYSKNSWLAGYGWGLHEDNKYAFYKNASELRSSAHTQIYATLFLFGWIGFIGYWGLLLTTVYRSYKALKNNSLADYKRVFAYFSFFAIILMVINEIKVDSVSFPNYFAMALIIVGLSLSNSKTKLSFK